MLNRRRFVQGLLAAAASPGGAAAASRHTGFGPLVPDSNRVLDLPQGFRYEIIATKGEPMDDGLLVPGEADGMAAFGTDNGHVVLVCNHENPPGKVHHGPYGAAHEALDETQRAWAYDFGRGTTPGNGGTTTIVYDPRQRRKVRQHMSLLGTELNCAGGATPWGSWLSCEECFKDPGTGFENNRVVIREQRHGYVFEVPASATGLIEPVPLRDMGRFEHEAAAVDPATGIVYLTEDRHRSLFYRYVPDRPGRLAAGGTLQALAVAGQPSFDTRNWDRATPLRAGRWHDVEWIDLPEADSDDNDLRLRGHAQGAALFARGEGLCYADGEVVITCTIGGRERLGQVFTYQPERGTDPGRLRLLAESTRDSLLRHADNVSLSPWGDLVICEDSADHCGLVGIAPGGRQYPIADNAYTSSELAGVCFSPQGDVLFVNIQNEGLTLAVSGPWPRS